MQNTYLGLHSESKNTVTFTTLRTHTFYLATIEFPCQPCHTYNVTCIQTHTHTHSYACEHIETFVCTSPNARSKLKSNRNGTDLLHGL